MRPVAATRKKGVVDAPGGLPKDLYLTANYLPSTTTRRRIKNIVVVLECGAAAAAGVCAPTSPADKASVDLSLIHISEPTRPY